MTYNDTYFRMFLLSEARRLALRGKALAEILAARAAYIPIRTHATKPSPTRQPSKAPHPTAAYPSRRSSR